MQPRARTKTAAELLEESKNLYVKSDAVRETRQVFEPISNLRPVSSHDSFEPENFCPIIPRKPTPPPVAPRQRVNRESSFHSRSAPETPETVICANGRLRAVQSQSASPNAQHGARSDLKSRLLALLAADVDANNGSQTLLKTNRFVQKSMPDLSKAAEMEELMHSQLHIDASSSIGGHDGSTDCFRPVVVPKPTPRLSKLQKNLLTNQNHSIVPSNNGYSNRDWFFDQMTINNGPILLDNDSMQYFSSISSIVTKTYDSPSSSPRLTVKGSLPNHMLDQYLAYGAQQRVSQGERKFRVLKWIAGCNKAMLTPADHQCSSVHLRRVTCT